MQTISVYVIDCENDVAISLIDFKNTVVQPIDYYLELGPAHYDIQVTISNWIDCPLFTRVYMQNPTATWNSAGSSVLVITETTNGSSPAMTQEFRITINRSDLALL